MVAQPVKDLALPLQQPGSLFWHGFDHWPKKLPHAMGVTKKKKKKKIVLTQRRVIDFI